MSNVLFELILRYWGHIPRYPYIMSGSPYITLYIHGSLLTPRSSDESEGRLSPSEQGLEEFPVLRALGLGFWFRVLGLGIRVQRFGFRS